MNSRNSTPVCIGIILDGNRRWAKKRGLPSFEGHRRGIDNVESIARAAQHMGIRHMVVYAFSTENWNRSKREVSYLMKIFESVARNQFSKLFEERIAVRFVGQRERLSSGLQNAIYEVEEKNPKKPVFTLWICISYGGRAEIVHAAQITAKIDATITQKSFEKHLWTAGMPDPDIIIRTGGEQRLSNFLLWQSAYSELFFLETYWPAFTKADLEAILVEYAKRERRNGR